MNKIREILIFYCLNLYCTDIIRTFGQKINYMEIKTVKEEVTRFDTRLSKEQKNLFEKAASLGGYRNLTSFIIVTVQNRAHEIIREQEQILASSKDAEIFFEALVYPVKPNNDLFLAAQEYKQHLSL